MKARAFHAPSMFTGRLSCPPVGTVMPSTSTGAWVATMVPVAMCPWVRPALAMAKSDVPFSACVRLRRKLRLCV